MADNHRGKVVGAVDCLSKPVTREALADAMEPGLGAGRGGKGGGRGAKVEVFLQHAG